MDHELNDFEIDYEGHILKVQRRLYNNQALFKIHFGDNRPALLLTRATGTDIGRHWTSIPEGRFEEAQEIGALIEQHYK